MEYNEYVNIAKMPKFNVGQKVRKEGTDQAYGDESKKLIPLPRDLK